ncbi:MAG: hypothetical protein ABSB58_03020 [Gemmatimonadales bacterium]|jgi:hypothetical protein
MSERFETIILVGRPAAGKSEVLDFLKKVVPAERERRFHIRFLAEIDDFPMVWETFEIDDCLQKLGQPRVFTDTDYFFLGDHVWDLFIERINLEFRKRLTTDPEYTERNTVLVEFARGGDDAFGHAFSLLSDDILKRAGIVYVNVSYEESLRKNRRRFDPKRPDSILHHSLNDAKMERYYRTNDWERLTGGKKAGRIPVRGFEVPFAVFDNEPEQTNDPAKLGPALEETLGKLWALTHPFPRR